MMALLTHTHNSPVRGIVFSMLYEGECHYLSRTGMISLTFKAQVQI
jgi:hypothetical protein